LRILTLFSPACSMRAAVPRPITISRANAADAAARV
jgi:hypothetical protein